MPFDAENYVPATVDPRSLTTPRERLVYLRDFLRGLPEDSPHYNYATWRYTTSCGTSCCIGGWAATFFLPNDQVYSDHTAGAALGLDETQTDDLFFNAAGFGSTATKAANVLTHMINTGEVDWSVA